MVWEHLDQHQDVGLLVVAADNQDLVVLVVEVHRTLIRGYQEHLALVEVVEHVQVQPLAVVLVVPVL
jgi:hypothetical protein